MTTMAEPRRSLSLKTFLRQTPFRLTLMFIFFYAIVAVVIFVYVYFAGAAESGTATDAAWARRGWHMGLKAIWGGAALLIGLGLVAGLLINREVSRSVQRLMKVLDAAENGDLKARVTLRQSGDEYDALAERINTTLDRMEATIGNLKHAGDAIAHDLRTPLSRLRSRLELALYEAEKYNRHAPEVLERALSDTDQLLRTFQTVFAISRLETQGLVPDPQVFDAQLLACDMAELFEPLAQDKGLEFASEFTGGLQVSGNRDFLAQALSNLLDNAIKYTRGGGITFRLRRTAAGQVEFSITDTGPGVPEADRVRITQRFVRLESSRSLPGEGLGLSLVEAVARAHGGRLAIDEGPGILQKSMENCGPGLRTALVLPLTGEDDMRSPRV